MFTSTDAGVTLSLTKVKAEAVPMTLTGQGATALASGFGTSPVAAGTPFFEGHASYDVLDSATS
ncbi:hypothetical protein [Streptomyces sp. NPDC127108]|uniref:hypothetical protein n=1 Tax=Streptomyces sp. NPDC127108 TaxID=3345361 RepID=UPI003627F995